MSNKEIGSLIQKGQLEVALAHLERKKTPDTETRRMLGYCQLGIGAYSLAEKTFNRLRLTDSADPGNTVAWVLARLRGRTVDEWLSEDRESAIVYAAIEHVLSVTMDSDSEDVYQWPAAIYRLMAELAGRTGLIDRERGLYESGIHLYPEDPEVVIPWAVGMLEVWLWSESSNEAGYVIDVLKPLVGSNHTEALYLSACAHKATGDMTGWHEAIQALAQQKPDGKGVLPEQLVADAYLELGQLKEATQELNKIREKATTGENGEGMIFHLALEAETAILKKTYEGVSDRLLMLAGKSNPSGSIPCGVQGCATATFDLQPTITRILMRASNAEGLKLDVATQRAIERIDDCTVVPPVAFEPIAKITLALSLGKLCDAVTYYSNVVLELNGQTTPGISTTNQMTVPFWITQRVKTGMQEHPEEMEAASLLSRQALLDAGLHQSALIWYFAVWKDWMMWQDGWLDMAAVSHELQDCAKDTYTRQTLMLDEARARLFIGQHDRALYIAHAVLAESPDIKTQITALKLSLHAQDQDNDNQAAKNTVTKLLGNGYILPALREDYGHYGQG